MRDAATVYQELTDGLRREIRVEELVFLAAERQPELLPSRAEIAAERARKQSLKEGAETSSGEVSATANRRSLRIAVEPLDLFRSYLAVYARERVRCLYTPALIDNLERNWQASQRRLKERAGT